MDCHLLGAVETVTDFGIALPAIFATWAARTSHTDVELPTPSHCTIAATPASRTYNRC